LAIKNKFFIISGQEEFIKSEKVRRTVFSPGGLKKGIGKSKELSYTSLGHRRAVKGMTGPRR